MAQAKPPRNARIDPATPLWTRAPARDDKGNPCVDFMMLIPGLKHADEAGVEACMIKVRNSLERFGNRVVYVDLNLKLSLLWVSAQGLPGITRELMLAIQEQIPEARVVAGDFNPESFIERRPRGLRALGRRVAQRFLLSKKP